MTNVLASDADAGTTLVYSISGGKDAGKFNIDTSTGELTFKVAPDFESQTDAPPVNGIYEVTVMASDGITSDNRPSM